MNLKRCSLFLVFWALLAVTGSGIAWAGRTTVSVGEVKGKGVSAEKLETVKSLLQAAVENHPDARLDDSAPVLTLMAELHRLDHSYIVLVNAHDRNGGLRGRQTKIKSFDEIDVAINRLVASVIENIPLEETAERGEVLEKEQKEPTLVKSVAGWEAFIGGAWPITNSLGSHKTMYSFGGGYMWDVTPWLVELRADFQAGFNDAAMNVSSFTIGGHYIWHETRKTALYSGLEGGFTHVEDNLFSGKSGFGVAGDTGVLLLRQADINVDLRARVLMLADKFHGSVPVIGSFLVGIHF